MILEGEINAKGALWTAGEPFVFEPSWGPDAQDFATKLNIAADKIGTGFVLYAIVLLGKCFKGVWEGADSINSHSTARLPSYIVRLPEDAERPARRIPRSSW